MDADLLCLVIVSGLGAIALVAAWAHSWRSRHRPPPPGWDEWG